MIQKMHTVSHLKLGRFWSYETLKHLFSSSVFKGDHVIFCGYCLCRNGTLKTPNNFLSEAPSWAVGQSTPRIDDDDLPPGDSEAQGVGFSILFLKVWEWVRIEIKKNFFVWIFLEGKSNTQNKTRSFDGHNPNKPVHRYIIWAMISCLLPWFEWFCLLIPCVLPEIFSTSGVKKGGFRWRPAPQATPKKDQKRPTRGGRVESEILLDLHGEKTWLNQQVFCMVGKCWKVELRFFLEGKLCITFASFWRQEVWWFYSGSVQDFEQG